MGQLHDIQQADVSLPALNSANVRPVQVRFFGQPFLGKAEP
jgi:hypothetical protein